MLASVLGRILEQSVHHARTLERYIPYGTAGFRTRADYLDHVMFRMGVLAGLRSKATNAAIGIVITASHNPEEDNGVKLVDPLGEMLDFGWEQFATLIANCPDSGLGDIITRLVSDYAINLDSNSTVFIGHDTRLSSPILSQSVIDGINSLSGEFVDYGVVSTPMIHYLIVCYNTSGAYGVATPKGYFHKLALSYRNIIGENPVNGNYNPTIWVDGANGVGSNVMKQVGELIGDNVLKVDYYNDGNGRLNHECGADFVKVNQRPPIDFPIVPGVRCASLDGDADRLIYFYFDENRVFHMLDGDKISLLFAEHLGELVRKANLGLRLGVVQTAYANGSSTYYVEHVLGLPVACVPTGIKHLHHAAQQFDIGVYFEANGHGTVVFSREAVAQIREKSLTNIAAKELACFLDVINSTVGDAISDMLTVEAILHSKGWHIQQWNNMYTDLPNRQLKVVVADRTVIQTTDAERVVSSPNGVQAIIYQLVGKYQRGRSFVRPSGTEDIVRVYAEAETQHDADRLATEVAQVVFDMCGGVGQRP